MQRLSLTTCFLMIGMLALGVPAADAAKKKSKTPSITRVTPMRVKVGKTLTVRGANYSSSRRRNTLVFIAPSGRTAFAKASRASRSKLVVKVPSSVGRLLSGPTRFKLRVVTKKYGKVSVRRVSPIVVPSSTPTTSCPKKNAGTSDQDKDGLSNSRETSLKTDPCVADTDGDGVEDGFEVESALDLNQRAVPYPGKRPFPNALDATDANDDYDGDGLTNKEEYQAWAHPVQAPNAGLLQAYSSSALTPPFGGPYGGRSDFGGHRFPINYSDGNQYSAGGTRDDLRDADGDGLTNIDELRLLMLQGYLTGECERKGAVNSYSYKPAIGRKFLQVNWLDSDSDGDSVLDGNDDQDNDDVSNVDEIKGAPGGGWQNCAPPDSGLFKPGPIDLARGGTPVLRNPYNPCEPDPGSRTCGRYY